MFFFVVGLNGFFFVKCSKDFLCLRSNRFHCKKKKRNLCCRRNVNKADALSAVNLDDDTETNDCLFQIFCICFFSQDIQEKTKSYYKCI
jgi:hypothetical protein